MDKKKKKTSTFQRNVEGVHPLLSEDSALKSCSLENVK